MEDIKQRIYVLKQQPLDFVQLFELGTLHQKLGDKLEARHYFKECITNYPDRAEGFHALGKLLLQENKILEANSYLSQALDIAPKSIDILLSLSKLHIARKGYEKTKSLLERANKLDPDNPEIDFMRGKLAYVQYDIFNARKYITKAIENALDPSKGEILYAMAILDTQQGFYKKALDEFEHCKNYDLFAPSSKENFYHIQHNMGYCHFRLGNYGIAQDIYSKLIQEDFQIQAETYINLAEIYWMQDNIHKAKECFEKANLMNSKAWPWMRELYTYTEKSSQWLTELMNNLPKEQNPGPNVAMYLGCVIPNRYPYIDAASRHTISALGVGIADLEGASCCPAPGVFRSFDIETWLSLGARNLTIAEGINRNLCVMCNGCYGTLNDINTELKEDPEKKAIVNKNLEAAGVQFKGTVDAEHIVWVLYNEIGVEKIKTMLKIPLNYKVAVHYGCHILKPIHNKPWKDSFETPTFMDELVELTGCKSIPHRDKLQCCGAGGGLRGSEKEVSLDFTKDKLESYRESGIDIIVTCCPFCHLQLDLGQMEINNIFKDQISAPFKFPVIYITQLIGLAMGIDPYRLGLQKHPQPKKIPPFTPVDPIFTTFFDHI